MNCKEKKKNPWLSDAVAQANSHARKCRADTDSRGVVEGGDAEE